jgi:hypothetical protein
MSRPTRASLDAAVAHIMAAPKDGATIEGLCLRPGYGERVFPDRIRVTRERGIPGERWETAPWLRLADGTAHPGIQVSILQRRVLDLIWRPGEDAPHPGDTFVVDMDLSEANMPVGQLLRAGSAVLRVSEVFNDACVKWKVRYGAEAKEWVTAPGHPPLRLRGVLCSVEADGGIANGDRLEKIETL